MNKILLTLIILLFTYNIYAFTIVENSIPICKIILSKDAANEDKFACEELNNYIEKITGIRLPVSEYVSKSNNIFIGQESANLVLKDYNWNKLKRDGILINFKNDNLILAGDKGAGTIYSVYTFIDDYLKVNFLTPTVEYIPKNNTIKVNEKNIEYVPPIMSRESFFGNISLHPEFAFKLKLNGHNNPIKEDFGGNYKILGFVHTFNTLIPLSKYKDTHPEYYSLVNGERRLDGFGQLCFSNPDLMKELVNNTLKWIEENPEYKIISVSQNDSGDDTFCKCQSCKAREEKYGISGSLLLAINEVADAVKEKYPDKFVETLAYHVSMEAPKGGVVPRDNVIIRQCSIFADVTKPLNHKNNKEFYDNLQVWSKIAKKLFIWDYVVNFGNYIILHPNFGVLQKNTQILRDNNVVAIFDQGDNHNTNSCFYAYKAYIIAKLLWNPDIDFTQESKEFMKGYYGDGGDYMYSIVDYLSKSMLKTKEKVTLYMLDNNYFTEKDWLKCLEYFNKALKNTENTEYYDRVYFDYMCFESGIFLIQDKKVFNKVINSNYVNIKNKNEFFKALKPIVKNNGVLRFAEPWFYDGSYFDCIVSDKQGDTPKECAELRDEDWVEIQEDAIQGTGGYIVNDPNASNGKAWCVKAEDRTWGTQCCFSYLYMDKSIKSADVYISYRIEPGSIQGLAYTGGIYNHHSQEGLSQNLCEFYGNESKDYTTKKIGSIDFTKTSDRTSLWIQGEGIKERSNGLYIDKIFIIFNRK